jgi:hypothetical protein
MKGAELLLRLSSGYSWELARQTLRVRANDSTIYIASTNWAAAVLTSEKLGNSRVTTQVNARGGGGGSMIIDYNGNIIAEATSDSPQLVMGYIDIMKLRKERELWKSANPLGTRGNYLANMRTELYAPYYARTVYPPNGYFKDGPQQGAFDEIINRRRKQSLANLKGFHDWYREDEVI